MPWPFEQRRRASVSPPQPYRSPHERSVSGRSTAPKNENLALFAFLTITITLKVACRVRRGHSIRSHVDPGERGREYANIEHTHIHSKAFAVSSACAEPLALRSSHVRIHY